MAYIAFSLCNTFVYSFPAHWVWADSGWLKKLDVVDVAGVGPVHLVGGVTALIAAIMLKPRKGRYGKNSRPYQHVPSSNPVNALLGLFMLWWGWLGFNCGSTFGISGGKWKLATRAAATTILASCGGGITSFFISYMFNKRKFIIPLIVNGILGALVSISAICAVTATWAAVAIGAVGAVVAALSDLLLFKLKIDDPVGASSVHFCCSIWGLLCCGIFAQKDHIEKSFNFHNGLIYGGGWYLLGVQTLAVVVITLWSVVLSTILLKVLDLIIGLRVSEEEEAVGADFFEHNILPPDGVPPSFIKDNAVKNGKDGSGKETIADEKLCFCFFRKITRREMTKGDSKKDEDRSKKEEEDEIVRYINAGFEKDEKGGKDFQDTEKDGREKDTKTVADIKDD